MQIIRLHIPAQFGIMSLGVEIAKVLFVQMTKEPTLLLSFVFKEPKISHLNRLRPLMCLMALLTSSTVVVLSQCMEVVSEGGLTPARLID